jgi:glycosyltransferase involved in cell wall biosynthesis
VTNRYWRVGGKDLCWQPLPDDARTVDLVILNQENSLLSNYPFLFRQGHGGPRIAFFGHGANLQSNRPNGLRERFKRWTTHRVDWWFAYTDMSVELVAASGFPRERITNVENAVDTAAMRAELASIHPEELAALRQRLGLEGGRVALYLGSLYAEKRLDFLIEAADRLHAADDLFRLVIVGDGPLREAVSQACAVRPWCVWVGARTGREKALYLALAEVILSSGAVGLGILDSFVAGVPMLTTDCGLHGPEVAYLRQQENGVMTENNVAAFVEAVERLLVDESYRAQLAKGCLVAADHYTVENMAKRFADGIVRCLEN